MTSQSSGTLTLTKSDSARTFCSTLAKRGIVSGFDVVQFPSVEVSSHDAYIPEPPTFPLADEVPTTLGALVEKTTEESLAYLGGVSDVASLPQMVAAHQDAALLRVDGAFSHAEDMFGSPLLAETEVTWKAGILPTALRLTRDGPVVLHIEDITQLDETTRNAVLTLTGASERVEFRPEGEAILANLGNLTVILSDVATPGDFKTQVGRASVFTRTFDVALFLSASQLYDAEKEQAYLCDVEGLSADFAKWFTRVAVQTREEADRDDGALSVGIPPQALVKWVHIAQAFDAEGVSEPIHRAAETAIVNVYYPSPEEHEIVTQTIASYLPPEFDD